MIIGKQIPPNKHNERSRSTKVKFRLEFIKAWNLLIRFIPAGVNIVRLWLIAV